MKRRTNLFQYITLISACCIFLLCAGAGIYNCISHPPEVENDIPVALPPEDTGDDVTGVTDEIVVQNQRKEDFYLILVGGMDNSGGGSDTNLLVALDAANHTIDVLSLPRDTLLNVSWSVKKLNNACHHGGFDRTVQEVSNLLGIPVDFYVTVDLNAFVQLIDAIGGVTFNVPVDMDYDDPYQDLHIHFSAGEQLLSGADALKVIRWRQNNDGTGYPTADIGRIATQQAFLKAAAKKALQLSNLSKLGEMAEIIHNNVSTDLELANILWLCEQAVVCGTENITFHTLPGDGAGWYSGGSYYIADSEATLTLINSRFNPYTRELTLDDMDILVP